MQVHDKYIIYNPTVQTASAAPKSEPVKLTPSAWQKETLGALELFDEKKTKFSPLTDSGSKQGEKTGREAPAAESPAASGGGEAQTVENSQAKEIINAPNGNEVLKPGFVLKNDQHPHIHNKKLQDGNNPQPLIEGAPNFRKVKDENTYGVGQPTVDGMKAVLKEAGAAPGCEPQKKAVWVNLREEPVVYINGKPHNLRQDGDKTIFKNFENPGATKEDVEAMEKKMKAEILEEAKKNGGKMLVADETPDGKVVYKWEKVDENSVKTVGEVYDDLKKEGYNVEYDRVPITDEKKPEPKDFESLTDRLKGVDKDTPVIFNCHAGRGRTTTGTVVASIIRKNQNEEASGKFTKNQGIKDDIREQGNYSRTEYRKIFNFINLIQKNPASKDEVDKLIDKNSDMQNLRDVIKTEKEKAGGYSGKAQDYLERYHSLISYDAYVKAEGPGFSKSYTQWSSEHPEINQQIETIRTAMHFPGNLTTAAA
ncbi:MAG: hypothetical protein LWY06_00255 [Firmicutes bacterium]|nr:hypothetical protein [Bacillota bacterium]